MNEQDYFGQFVGDDPEPVYDFGRWPAVTSEIQDRLNRIVLEYSHTSPRLWGGDVTRHPDAVEQCHIYGRHTWQTILGGRRCVVCGKQEAVPVCEDGTHIWGASVLGPTFCVVCGAARLDVSDTPSVKLTANPSLNDLKRVAACHKDGHQWEYGIGFRQCRLCNLHETFDRTALRCDRGLHRWGEFDDQGLQRCVFCGALRA